MPEKLVCSNNSLSDLVKWSKWGYVIILSTSSTHKIFSRPEFVKLNKIVKITLSKECECLINEGEWPYYLINTGCQEMQEEDLSNLNFSNMVEFTI